MITGWSQVNNSGGSSDIPTTFDLTVAPAPLSAAAAPLTAAVAAPAPAASSAAVVAPTGLTLTLSGGTAPALTAPIDLDSFKFGFHNPTTIGSITGGAGTGKATFDALSVTAAAGAASPLLFYALATNAPYDTATLTRYDAAGHPVAVGCWGRCSPPAITTAAPTPPSTPRRR